MFDDITNSSRDNLKTVVSILTKQKSGLRIAHINAQSLNNKIDELRYTFVNSGLDVICVSESWCRPALNDNIYKIPGYDIFRADRLTNGGGVAIYIKSGINCTIKCKSTQGCCMEYLFIELTTLANNRILVGCVYRPNNHTDFSSLISCIESLSLNYNDIVIAGDFNSNLLAESNLTNAMQIFGLLPYNTTLPTHFTRSCSSLLDVFFVSRKSKILLYDQLSAPGFSKHDLIYITYDFNLNLNVNNSTIKFRDIRNIDWNTLCQLVNGISWDAIHQFNSVNDQLDFLQDNITGIYNACVPEKTKVICHKQPPWFNAEIKKLIDVRNLAYKRWKRFKTQVLHDNFKSARAAVLKLINSAKSSYFKRKFQLSIDSKCKWKEIRKIGICDSRNETLNSNINVDELNERFVNINVAPPSGNIYEHIHTDPIENCFTFRCVDDAEVLQSILSVKSNAVGMDGIDPTFVKIILPRLLPYITFLFNTVLTKSIFPHGWKMAKIIPLPKQNNEFRPIAMLPFLSKALEHIMADQISIFLDQHKLISENQSGFRKKRSCVTVLIDVVEGLRQKLDDKMTSFLVLLDHSKAFDTVNHNILISKLKNLFHFSDTACKLMSSYLSNRSQTVIVGNNRSNSLDVSRGVPQGSILGPLLFSIYINDLPDIPTTCNIQMYADDVQLYASAKLNNIPSCISNINNDLELIYKWAVDNGLCLNPSKTKFLSIYRRNLTETQSICLKLENSFIDRVETSKNLGLIFNSKLTWTNHINGSVGKVRAMLRNLWAVRTSTPFNIRMLLAKSYIIPTLLYGSEIFASCDSEDTRKLNVAYNDIARYVFNKKRHDRISQYAYKIFNVSFDNLLKIKCLTQIHKIIYCKEPDYLFNRLKFARSNRGMKLITPRIRSLTSERQFFICSTRLWNNLPSNIQLISNAINFKKEIFKFFR